MNELKTTPELSSGPHEVQSGRFNQPGTSSISTFVPSLAHTSNSKQKAHNVVVHPRLKPMPFKFLDVYPTPPPQPFQTPTNIKNIQFYQVEDLPVNRRGFKYKLCRPLPVFTSNFYATTDLPPYDACINLFDRSTGILFSKDCKTITTLEGWRSARANVCIREGKYYFEFKIVKANDYNDDGNDRNNAASSGNGAGAGSAGAGGAGAGNSGNDKKDSHVRIGIARKEAALEAPVGYDGYGYGLRDIDGQLMFTSRRKKQCVYEDGFKTGDVIGLLVELPSLKEQKEQLNRYVEEKKLEIPVEHKSKKRKTKNKKSTAVGNAGGAGGVRDIEQLEQGVEANIKFNEFNNIVRDQIPTKSKGVLYYDQFEYTKTKTMDHLLNPVTVFGEKAIIEMDDKTKNIPIIANAQIRVFKNGIEQGTIDDLYSFLPTNIEDVDEMNLEANVKQLANPNYKNTDDNTLGYYPMISVFNNGVASLNAGPDFEFPPNIQNGTYKPLSDRYEEQVIEEWYWDVLDEVEAQYLDSFED